jgi:hypothetical protein
MSEPEVDSVETSTARVLRWMLWRQDDNGNKHLIERFPAHRSAEEALKRFEARHHRQIYWLEGEQRPPA